MKPLSLIVALVAAPWLTIRVTAVLPSAESVVEMLAGWMIFLPMKEVAFACSRTETSIVQVDQEGRGEKSTARPGLCVGVAGHSEEGAPWA